MGNESVEIIAHWVEALRLSLLDVPGFTTLSSAPYLFRPFLMLLALGIVGGLVGVIVNVHAVEFTAEAMVHSVFPGVVAGAVYVGTDGIIPGAACAAILAVVVLTLLRGMLKGVSESGTAVVLTTFYAIGIVISLYKGDMSGQLEALMFGRLLEVSPTRMVESLLVCCVGFVVIVLSWRSQVFVAFDRQGAQAAGMHTARADICLNVALGAIVVAGASAIGILLVIGYLIVPGAAARLLASTMKTMIPIAVLVGVGGGYIGMLVMNMNTVHPISPQASVALALVALFFVALLLRLCRNLCMAVYSSRRSVREEISCS